MRRRYYDLNSYYRGQFGVRVHKLTVDAGRTCPNRDGTVGEGGCIFCNARGSGTGAYARGFSITEQLLAAREAVGRRFKARQFIAYFQSYSNTYASLETLRAMLDEALAVPDIVGLAIGTRPDCVDDAVLDLLQGYARERMVWIEYGLQSAHDATLKLIHRGHTAECFRQAVLATAGRGLHVCAHIILGLPGETVDHVHATADFIAALPIEGVKIHLLYVIKGTALHNLYSEGAYRCLEQLEYVDLVCDTIERLPADMVIQRLTGDPHRDELAAPLWALHKNKTLNLITRRLEERDTWQGRLR